MRVDEIMKAPETCRTGGSVRDCAKLMKKENVGFVPVCNEDGEPVGTITDRDIALRVVAEGRGADTRIDDVMTREVVACHVGDELADAERLMRENRKSRVMVLDDGKLVGVISLSDVIEAEDEGVAADTMRAVASREARQPHAS
jgi:CBS domain-containing protein